MLIMNWFTPLVTFMNRNEEEYILFANALLL